MSGTNPVAIRRLKKDYENLQKVGPIHGFFVSLFDEDDLFTWKVKVQVSEQSQIGKDLKKLNLLTLDLELKFPDAYPFDFPFVKILQPRMKANHGNILFGGVLCLSLLTDKEWSCSISSESLVIQIVNSLVSNENKIDLDSSDMLYSQEEYNAALFRSSLKKTTSKIPTIFNYIKAFTSSIHPTLIGNKILMDPSVLQDISSKGEIPTPMVFEIYNNSNHMKGFCGVLEFSANPGKVVFPKEVAQQLFLEEGSKVLMRLVSLPKGNLIKFQAHSMDFIEMNDNDNDKVISLLENGLSHYSVLTIGDTIQVSQGSITHLLNVLSCFPSEVVTVVSNGPYLDLKIEFASPLNFKEKKIENNNNNNFGHSLLETNQNDNTNSAQCINCGRYVPSSSLDMHTPTCLRRNTRCEKCGIVYEKSNIEKHQKEYHSLVRCKCGEELEQYELKNHEFDSCSLRKVACKYCGMQMENIFLEEHEKKCSTRTVLCEKCNTYVKLSTLGHHQLTKCSGALIDDEEPTYSCSFCSFEGLHEQELIHHIEIAHASDLKSQHLVCPICLAKKGPEALDKSLENFQQHLEWHETILIQKKKHRNNKLPGTGLPKLNYFND